MAPKKPEDTDPLDAGQDAPAAAGVLDAPAVDPGAFAPGAGEGAPAAPPLETPTDYRKAVAGILKALDRALSFALRVERSPASELAEFEEILLPAARAHGPKLGARFWSLVAIAGFLAFILGKLTQRLALTAAGSERNGAAPAGGERQAAGGRLDSILKDGPRGGERG